MDRNITNDDKLLIKEILGNTIKEQILSKSRKWSFDFIQDSSSPDQFSELKTQPNSMSNVQNIGIILKESFQDTMNSNLLIVQPSLGSNKRRRSSNKLRLSKKILKNKSSKKNY